MKVNLHTLSCELAAMDNPKARDHDVIAAETIIAALGKRLRSASLCERWSIIRAILKRAGK